jgi:ribonucleoside-triphosphate reductase
MEKQEILLKIEALETELKNVKGTECEVYSRIVGYFRPVKQWNNGKQEEFNDRTEFELAREEEEIKVS